MRYSWNFLGQCFLGGVFELNVLKDRALVQASFFRSQFSFCNRGDAMSGGGQYAGVNEGTAITSSGLCNKELYAAN